MTPKYTTYGVSFGGFPSGFRHQLHHRWESWILDGLGLGCWWSNSESLGNGFWAFFSLGMFGSPQKKSGDPKKIQFVHGFVCLRCFDMICKLIYKFPFWRWAIIVFPQEVSVVTFQPSEGGKFPRNQACHFTPIGNLKSSLCIQKELLYLEYPEIFFLETW